MTEEALEPTDSRSVFDGAVEVHCFGSRYGDWSMRGESPEEAERNNPGIVGRMRRLSEQYCVSIFSPNPGRFNARVVHVTDLQRGWIPCRLYRGEFADGVTLAQAGQAFGVTSSDCPTIVARNPATGLVVGAHAGRESLYHREALLYGAPLRRHDSVVSAIADALGKPIEAHVACGIAAENFTHPVDDPKYGNENAHVARYLRDTCGRACVSEDLMGRIDLLGVILAQFARRGVDRAAVTHDGIDTYGDRDDASAPKWNSHRRDRNGARNLVLVIRRR